MMLSSSLCFGGSNVELEVDLRVVHELFTQA